MQHNLPCLSAWSFFGAWRVDGYVKGLRATRSGSAMIYRSIALLAALGSAIFALSSETSAQASCGPRGQLVKLLADHYKETPIGIGLAQPGQVLEVFASQGRSWSMVMTMPDGKACLIAAGDNWEMVTKIKGSPI
jgi:hypothetical protein